MGLLTSLAAAKYLFSGNGGGHRTYRPPTPEEIEEHRRFVEESKKNNKPLIVSECCWGSFDDAERAKLIRGALTVFNKYNIGFVAHALQYCGCADLHDFGDGRTTPNIGNLCFVNKDGKIRPHHEVFNEF